MRGEGEEGEEESLFQLVDIGRVKDGAVAFFACPDADRVVDAIDDEAQSFYQHYHFVPVRNRERRLVMKVSTAAKALGERWRQ